MFKRVFYFRFDEHVSKHQNLSKQLVQSNDRGWNGQRSWLLFVYSTCYMLLYAQANWSSTNQVQETLDFRFQAVSLNRG